MTSRQRLLLVNYRKDLQRQDHWVETAAEENIVQKVLESRIVCNRLLGPRLSVHNLIHQQTGHRM